MFSHRSTLFREAVAFHKEFLRAFPLESIGEHYVEHLDALFLSYLETLARALEKPKGEKASFEKAKRKLLYGVIAALSLGQARPDEDVIQEVESSLRCFLERQEQRLFARKKIVILTIHAGQGHTSAAKALVSGICEQYGHDSEVVLKDLDVDLNTFYESTVKHTPQIYKFLFEASNSAEGMSVVGSFGYPMFAKKLDQMLEEENPDLIVSTYSFPGINTWIEKSLRKQPKHVPYVTVITDSISIHQMWFGKSMDYYIVANKETQDAVVKKGVPKSKVKVLGFPVKPKFFEQVSKEVLRVEKGLDPERMTFMISIGTGSTIKDAEFLKDFQKKLGSRAQCVVILGKNTELLSKLQAMNLGKHVHLKGWVHDMYKYMQLADVVVTKAGGATVMECVAAHRPMIITKVLPGQEQGNAELIKKHKLGVVLGKKQDVLESMIKLTEKPKEWHAMQKNFEKVAIDGATFKIADFLISLLK